MWEMSGASCILGIKTEIKSFELFFILSAFVFPFLVLHCTSCLWLVRRLQLQKSGRLPGKVYFRAVLCQGLLQVIVTDKGPTYHLNLLQTDDRALGTGGCWASSYLLRKRCEKFLVIIVKY